MFPKTKFQVIGESELGVTAERDPEKHRAARRLLNPGFSTRAFKTREQVIHDHTDQFVSQLKEYGNAEQGVDFCEVRSRMCGIDVGLTLNKVVPLASLGYRGRHGVWAQIRKFEES